MFGSLKICFFFVSPSSPLFFIYCFVNLENEGVDEYFERRLFFGTTNLIGTWGQILCEGNDLKQPYETGETYGGICRKRKKNLAFSHRPCRFNKRTHSSARVIVRNNKTSSTFKAISSFEKKVLVRPPGFEPGSSTWQADVLDQTRLRPHNPT